MNAHLLSTVDETAPSRCHHCGAPLGRRSREITVSGREVQVCGDACRTAVETIANAGLDAWYGLRTHPDAQGAATADPRYQAEIDAWRVPEVEAALLRRTGEVASVPVRLDAPADALRAASTSVRFTIEAVGAGDIRATEEARFLGPAGG